ncbi:uncharacterized protein EI90DRAFT_1994756 [Cantharellus anzutake]|uniref:uncharacterized protein n=1 Tax=Cantharellus anzutake TaxID=1750568 RepID=UPI001902D412|nr:uncharacterized protein EI90DRAFT_1994756 [Cantharellus anzutake]KAF8326086.1 hypothetical protein EI90DRAFT_1994756 [Cantharellus anzutake]
MEKFPSETQAGFVGLNNAMRKGFNGTRLVSDGYTGEIIAKCRSLGSPAIPAMKELMASWENRPRARISRRVDQSHSIDPCAGPGRAVQQQPSSYIPVYKSLTTFLGEDLGFLPHTLSHAFFSEMNKHIDDLSFKSLCKARCRGAAFQCTFQQPCIDGSIVTYCGSLDEPFQRE